ncbi:MAG TPA: hypothetical protein VNM92_00985 [Thermoanaerobaculia bacterium]|nr:hypothetical protein [Thermoanaerobaculia bacterium]
MAQFLLITTLFTIAGLIGTMIVGYTAAAPADVTRHILFALATVVIGLFSQSMTMFFFIGTGKEIKDKSKKSGDALHVAEQTKSFKSRVFPTALYTMAVLMVTFIIGGGVHTGKVPSWVHQAMSFASLLMFLRAYWIELRAMSENATLMERFLKDSE